MFSRYFIVFSSLLLSLSCRQINRPVADINIQILHAIHQTILIETLPRTGTEVSILDSAIVTSNNQIIQLKIPVVEEIPCRLYIRGTDLSIPFILHADKILIRGNIFLPKEGSAVQSPVNTPLFAFLREQELLIQQGNRIMGDITSDNQSNKGIQKVPSYDSVLQRVQMRYREYADTVSSSGAFLYIYNYIDFGKQYGELKNFIQATERRFPKSDIIRQLREKTFDYLQTFEIEYQEGDLIPPIVLKDVTGNAFYVKPAGKFMLINFWASWCSPCFPFIEEERNIINQYHPANLEIINIALDPDKDYWRSIVVNSKLPGTNLLDDKVWEGQVIHHWRIDSIPFNWLLDKQGKLISKAISKDSLVAVLKRASAL